MIVWSQGACRQWNFRDFDWILSGREVNESFEERDLVVTAAVEVMVAEGERMKQEMERVAAI